MDAQERKFGRHFAKIQCGVLHAEWAMDAFWGEVTQNIILPGCLAIHQALVEKKITEKNKIDFNDADDTVYFIPVKDKGRKVFVHTSQTLDYLYIISDDTGWNSKTGKSFPVHNLHIRRIFRDVKEDSYMFEELKKDPSIRNMLAHADSLNDYHDDHYKYSHRPSLKAYKKVDFQVPYHPENGDRGRDFYGDFRDGGYVLSFKGRHPEPSVEGSVISFSDLKYISTIYLSCIADELEIKIPKLDGYR